MITGGTGSFGNAVLQRFLDSDVREIRIFSRDELKQENMRLALKSGKYKFESFVTDSTQYVFLNKKTVIAAGLVHMQGRYYDTPYKLDGRFTAVYIKRKRQWQLAAWQTTKKVN